MNIFKKFGSVFLKGFGMGAASVVPGVSAGTIALLTGIFPILMDSLDSISRKRTWKALFSGRFGEFWICVNGSFLLALAAGFVVSILALAKLVKWGLEYWPVQTWSFFFGLIVISTILMLKGIKNIRLAEILFILLGAGMGVGIFCLTPHDAPDTLLYIFVCGAVSVCTMLLPGISGSFVLQIMGKYEYIMGALDFQAFNWPVLIAFASGCVIGILAFAKFLKWLMGKWEKQTLLILTGFVIGSLFRIWPYSDMEALEAAQTLRTGTCSPFDFQIPGAVLWCAIGMALVLAIQFIGSRSGNGRQ